jgi:hypothetical protein
LLLDKTTATGAKSVPSVRNPHGSEKQEERYDTCGQTDRQTHLSELYP